MNNTGNFNPELWKMDLPSLESYGISFIVSHRTGPGVPYRPCVNDAIQFPTYWSILDCHSVLNRMGVLEAFSLPDSRRFEILAVLP